MAQKELTLDIMSSNSDSYSKFESEFRAAIAGKKTTTQESVKGRPVLELQTGDKREPPRWIHVVLKGKGSVAPKLAIRSDNVYVYAFTNSAGEWFKLSKGASTVLPGAKPLGYEGSYQVLVGGSSNLSKYKLSKFSVADAAAALWGYTQTRQLMIGGEGTLGKNLSLKEHLAILCVALSEAARLASVHDVVRGGWDDAQGGAAITSREIDLINDWSDVSKYLLAWKGDGYNNDDKWFSKLPASLNIKTGAAAVKEVQLVLNKPAPTYTTLILSWLNSLWGRLVSMLMPAKPISPAEN